MTFKVKRSSSYVSAPTVNIKKKSSGRTIIKFQGVSSGGGGGGGGGPYCLTETRSITELDVSGLGNIGNYVDLWCTLNASSESSNYNSGPNKFESLDQYPAYSPTPGNIPYSVYVLLTGVQEGYTYRIQMTSDNGSMTGSADQWDPMMFLLSGPCSDSSLTNVCQFYDPYGVATSPSSSNLVHTFSASGNYMLECSSFDAPIPLPSGGKFRVRVTRINSAVWRKDGTLSNPGTISWNGSYYLTFGNISGEVWRLQPKPNPYLASYGTIYEAGGYIGGSPPVISGFTVGGSGPDVYFHRQGSADIYMLNNPNTFANGWPVSTTYVCSLDGGLPTPTSPVVFNETGTEFIAMNGSTGVISRWDTNGNFLGNVTLSSPRSNNSILKVGGKYLTYEDYTLSIWDTSGNLLKSVKRETLKSTDLQYLPETVVSFCYARGLFWTTPTDGNVSWAFDASYFLI